MPDQPIATPTDLRYGAEWFESMCTILEFAARQPDADQLIARYRNLADALGRIEQNEDLQDAISNIREDLDHARLITPDPDLVSVGYDDACAILGVLIDLIPARPETSV